MDRVLAARDLTVRAGSRTLLDGVNLHLDAGETLTVLGETGAGKSLLLASLMGVFAPGLAWSGEICVLDRVLRPGAPNAIRSLWGRQVALLPQEPWQALDPLMPGADQVAEVHADVLQRSPADVESRTATALAEVGLQAAGHKYPWQLSGGMAQRLAFTAATAAGARVLLADEPTKGLDASLRDQVVALLRRFSTGGLVTVTHDVEVARQLGGRVMVLLDGRVVESGAAATVLNQPQARFAQDLLAAAPTQWPVEPRQVPGVPLLTAKGLQVSRGGRTLFRDFDLSLAQGEIVGLWGDSGVGKSSLGDAILGLVPIDAGQIQWNLPGGGLAGQRLKLYQDPPAAFAPRIPLGRLLTDVLDRYRIPQTELLALLQKLHLAPELLARPVGAVSGGELQRLAMARALLLKPRFLFADEPTSRLDPITEREVMLHLVSLARQSECAVLLVSHHRALLERVCDRVVNLQATEEDRFPGLPTE